MSRLHVRYKDGTYVELGAGSSFQVERIRFNPPNLLPSNKAGDQFDETIFRFNQGIARVTAPDIHAYERFTIRAQAAIVRTTGPADFYLIQLENDRDLTVRVSRGKVELMNLITNEAMPVPERTGAYTKVSGVVSGAGAFSDDQLTFLKSRTRI
ncbi:MAG: FecR domain-containing protein [Deltaproteobacteria bacterium]|nr:FecR domain-containing protein [Deltaproteobacteria bacterium]